MLTRTCTNTTRSPGYRGIAGDNDSQQRTPLLSDARLSACLHDMGEFIMNSYFIIRGKCFMSGRSPTWSQKKTPVHKAYLAKVVNIRQENEEARYSYLSPHHDPVRTFKSLSRCRQQLMSAPSAGRRQGRLRTQAAFSATARGMFSRQLRSLVRCSFVSGEELSGVAASREQTVA